MLICMNTYEYTVLLEHQCWLSMCCLLDQFYCTVTKLNFVLYTKSVVRAGEFKILKFYTTSMSGFIPGENA